MSVEHKHRKFCDKLYTDTSSNEKIFMRTRPCKTKSCAEGPLFTVNTYGSPVLRVAQINVLRHDFECEKLLLRRVRKLSRAVVRRFDLSVENLVTNMASYV